MTKNKNFLLILAAFAVIALGSMAYMIYYQDRLIKSMDKDTLSLTRQSTSTQADSIEEDIKDTDLENLDRELTDIEIELNSSN